MVKRDKRDTTLPTIVLEAGRGAEAQSVTANATSCGFDRHSRK